MHALVESNCSVKTRIDQSQFKQRPRPLYRPRSHSTSMSETPSAFWNFSVAFYAREGVAACCLELQDQAGADVNVVLFLFFLATHSRQLSLIEVQKIDQAVADWREQVVRPLRAARRHLKSAAAPFDTAASSRLRDEIKRDELGAERIQQHTLEQLFTPQHCGTAVASATQALRNNLKRYAELTGPLPAAASERMIDIFSRQFE